MGRPRVKINLELLRRLRKPGVGWRTLQGLYYHATGQEINWMTLKRRLIEAELAAPEGNNGHYALQP